MAAFAALAYRHRVGDEGVWRASLQHALDAVNMLRNLAAQGADHGGAFVGTTLYWAGDVGCLWASLRAFHESPDLPALIIGYATGLPTAMPFVISGQASPLSPLSVVPQTNHDGLVDQIGISVNGNTLINAAPIYGDSTGQIELEPLSV